MTHRFTWLQTHSGKKFDFINPTPDMIDIRDIARGLAREPRFASQSNLIIYVAEHSMYVADNLPEHLKLEGLLHDAAEAYTGDIPGPLKGLLAPILKPIERKIEQAIATRYGLTYPWPREIKQIDEHALYCEATHLFGGKKLIENWHEAFRQPIKADNTRLHRKVANGVNPNAAKLTEEFLAMAMPLILKREMKG